MRLYHGSNVEVREPRLLEAQRALDFGAGFYTTTNLDQAKRWAVRQVRVRKSGVPCVMVYDLAEDAIEVLLVRRFESADQSWLDFVTAHRKGLVTESSEDLVIGPIANDQTMPTLTLYLDGYLTGEDAIRQLRAQKLSDQVVFKSVRALEGLRFREVLRI